MRTSLVQLSRKEYLKQQFIMNALEDGWNIKKRKESYIFTKKHENKKEVFQENYLEEFILKSASSYTIDLANMNGVGGSNGNV
jgi:hypothetical protein